MVSSARQAIACILFILGVATSSQSQTAPAKSPTASISGKVTSKNKAVPGIVVMATDPNYTTGQGSRYRGTTDQVGNYRITNLPAGSYNVSPMAPSLVAEDELNNSVVITEGEAVEDVNFALVHGGVITGKITDSDGQPLIEEYVSVVPVDDQSRIIRSYGTVQTDDRGVYRAFGLRQGKYRVSAGQAENRLPGMSHRSYRQTFYPSVADSAKATLIEVTEGSETKDVDIVVSRPVATFKVAGRIIDGETGKPLPNINYGVAQSTGDGGGQSITNGAVSNANGEFKFESVLPGKYSVFIVMPENSDMRAEATPFEVVDRDVPDLLIKTSRGASLAGIVVLEGSDETAAIAKLGGLHIYAWVEKAIVHYRGSPSNSVKSDGTFRIGGLPDGTAQISLIPTSRAGSKAFGIVRIERDGVPQLRGIILKDGEQVDGLRVVIKLFSGAIRGQVKVESGDLPPTSRMSIWINPVEGNLTTFRFANTSTPSPQLDSRGRFFVEGLAAGVYEVNVAVFQPGRSDSRDISKQQVTVTDDAVTEVTITVKAPSP